MPLPCTVFDCVRPICMIFPSFLFILLTRHFSSVLFHTLLLTLCSWIQMNMAFQNEHHHYEFWEHVSELTPTYQIGKWRQHKHTQAQVWHYCYVKVMQIICEKPACFNKDNDNDAQTVSVCRRQRCQSLPCYCVPEQKTHFSRCAAALWRHCCNDRPPALGTPTDDDVLACAACEKNSCSTSFG